MARNFFTSGTMPVAVPPDPLLLFIQRAQLAIYYDDCHPDRPCPGPSAVTSAGRTWTADE
jgi:hypothetical protein